MDELWTGRIVRLKTKMLKMADNMQEITCHSTESEQTLWNKPLNENQVFNIKVTQAKQHMWIEFCLYWLQPNRPPNSKFGLIATSNGKLGFCPNSPWHVWKPMIITWNKYSPEAKFFSTYIYF